MKNWKSSTLLKALDKCTQEMRFATGTKLKRVIKRNNKLWAEIDRRNEFMKAALGIR